MGLPTPTKVHLAAALVAVTWSTHESVALAGEGDSAITLRERPLFELQAHSGVAAPFVFSGRQAIGAAPVAGGLLLWRVHPRWAFGMMGDYMAFPWDARTHEFHDAEATVHSGLLGAAGRHYFFESGRLDTHLQLALGYGFLDHSVSSSACSVGTSIGVQAASGVDVYVARWVRLTGSTAFPFVMSGSTCLAVSRPGDAPDPPLVLPGMSLRLGATFGIL